MKLKIIIFLIFLVSLVGCASFLPQSGPTTTSIIENSDTNNYITVIKLTPELSRLVMNAEKKETEKINKFNISKYLPVIDSGDILQVIIYETPPAVLFSGSSPFIVQPQIVNDKGYINVPVIGDIYVKGKEPYTIAKEIQKALREMANNPQVIVNVVDFSSSYVTVFGHVKQSSKISLTYTNSSLLDILAAAGGVTSPTNKTIIQIDRDGETIKLPLEEIIKTPSLNINMKPKDTITVIFKTQSATFLGASNKNEELEFEAQGITLSQGLGRVGGLSDDRANAKGLFVFRMEDADLIKKIGFTPKLIDDQNKTPVVYNIDMTEAESLFAIKNFYLKDKDIVYIATAPAVQWQKFLHLVNSFISPTFTIQRIIDK